MGVVIAFIKKNRITITPCAVFLLTFLWERYAFPYSDDLPNASIQRAGNYISRHGEWVMTYVLSRILCFLILFLICRCIFYLFENKKNIRRSVFVTGTVIYLTGLAAGIFLYPEVFGPVYSGIDNYTNYAMAVRFVPTYWQSIYTGALYAACIMIIPHPLSIILIEWTLFFSVTAYMYFNLEKLYPDTWVRFFPLLFLLIPEAYYLAFDAYRNNYYTLLLLFYVSFMYFKISSKEAFSLGDNIVFILCTAFLMVWRSEGVLIGAGAAAVYVLDRRRKKDMPLKRSAMVILAVILFFVLIKKPQDIGVDKYYGQDYMLLNTTNVLNNILNDPKAELSYEGSDDDLAAIDAVVPAEILKEYGMDGFRGYNWSKGHEDFNQTLSDDETAGRYMRAYYSIVLHNPESFFNTQINNLYSSLQLKISRPVYTYEGEHYMEVEPFDYSVWTVGLDEVRGSVLTKEWTNLQFRRLIRALLYEMILVWRELIVNSGLNPLIHALALIADVLIFIVEFVRIIKEKGSRPLFFFIAFLIILGELAALVVFMPVAREAYMYPVLGSSYLMLFFYFLSLRHKGENSEKVISAAG